MTEPNTRFGASERRKRPPGADLEMAIVVAYGRGGQPSGAHGVPRAPAESMPDPEADVPRANSAVTPCYNQRMTVQELISRFPEVSPELAGEPTVAEFAETFSDLLAVARKPSNCSTGHDAANHYYLKLIGPLSYYRYGLATRERVVADLRALLDRHAADPDGFAASLLPEDAAVAEVRGPGCD